MRLLLIEDNDTLRGSLDRGLTAAGHVVDAVANGLAGWEAAGEARHELIVLDRMLPGLDGLEVLRRLRRSGSRVPVLLLTARDGVEDRVAGLDAGVDDYLVKPFAVAELLVRIRALGRRGDHRADPLIVLADLEIDTAARLVRRGPRRLDLTPKEYQALEYLAARMPAVVGLMQAMVGNIPSGHRLLSRRLAGPALAAWRWRSGRDGRRSDDGWRPRPPAGWAWRQPRRRSAGRGAAAEPGRILTSTGGVVSNRDHI